jgi:hypothetical protein
MIVQKFPWLHRSGKKNPIKGEKTMSKDINVRWGWLKGMYLYTIFGAGGIWVGNNYHAGCSAIHARLATPRLNHFGHLW